MRNFRLSESAPQATMEPLNEKSGNGSQDGSSPARAVPVNSVGEEYEWMRLHCAGLKLVKQSLCELDGKPFDVHTLRDANAAEREVYFDISSFYGKD
jgi:hypothetical protein